MATPNQWHTPTVVTTTVAATAVDTNVSRERLASLMKQTNYLADQQNEVDDAYTTAAYFATFPNKETPNMKRNPGRYIYQMMAELITDDVEALQLAQELSMQLQQQQRQQWHPRLQISDAESLRDHMGADNIIRHMHRTPSAYNRGPPDGADPYLGTGLNPAHVSGVVSPNDGLQREMACCGQPVGSPGCWIRLVDTQPTGKLVPYQVWFTKTPPTSIWQEIALKGLDKVVDFINATVTGTAFLRTDYYSDLDRQIRKLVQVLAPAVVQVQRNILSGVFNQPVGYALLDAFQQKQLKQLVSLIQRYNAPQMGACHHNASITDEYLEAHVFFTDVGRQEYLQDRLSSDIRIGSIDVPLVRESTAEAFTATVFKLFNLGLKEDNPAFEAIQNLSSLASAFDTIQDRVKASEKKREEGVTLFNQIEREAQSITLSNFLFDADIKQNRSVFYAAKTLTDELNALLKSLPIATNDLIRSKLTDGYDKVVQDIRLVLQKYDDIASAMIDVKFDYWKKILELVTVSDSYLDSTYTTPNSELMKYLFLPNPKAYLKAILVVIRMNSKKTTSIGVEEKEKWSSLANQLEARRNELRELADQEIKAYEANKANEAARKAADEAARKEADASRSSAGTGGGRLISVEVTPTKKANIDITNWRIVHGFNYATESCTYDSLFPALFMIPNQWFRRRVVEAKQVFREPNCPDASAKLVHKSMLATINYMEEQHLPKAAAAETYDTIIECKTRAFWNECLPTSGVTSSKFGNPMGLLTRLLDFYGLEAEATFFLTPYGEWKPNYDRRRTSKLRMFVIMRDEPLQGKEFSMKGKYDIELTNGEFSMVSCIIYTKDHWQACVRDPRTDVWYRILDKGGIAQRLKDSMPPEIVGITETDPARTRVKYEPAAWIYYETQYMGPLYETLKAHPKIEDERGLGKQDDMSAAGRLFGYIQEKTTGQTFALTSEDSMNEIRNGQELVIGLMTALYFISNRNANPDGNRISNKDKWQFVFENELNFDKINSKILEPLRYVLISRKLGTYALKKNDDDDDELEGLSWTNFIVVAEITKLKVGDHWAPAWKKGFPAINPLSIDNVTEKEAFRGLAKAWYSALFWLLTALRQVKDKLNVEKVQRNWEIKDQP